MQNNTSNSTPWAFYLAAFGIAFGLVLTLVSWLKLCSTLCNDAHNYRLFGMPFEVSGAAYFIALAVALFKSKRALGFLIACGLGAEAFFIFIQKYQIGSWCPVCLTIAGTIAFIGICSYFIKNSEIREDSMGKWKQIALLTLVFTLGFGTSFFGVSKIDQLQAVEDSIKNRIVFGNPGSPVEVFIFTDWACPACRAVEPSIEAMAPKITREAKLTFVDTVVHPETLNYAPYNISFMVNSKSKYFAIREALGKLSIKTKKPSDQDIQKAVASLGVHFHELPYEDVSLAMRYFEELVDKFKVTGTPTVAIVNRDAKKGKKLSGVEEITEANVLKAIQSLR